MRLFLLPLSTRQSLIYCQKRSRLPGQNTYLDRVTSKASETWMKWEKHEKGWQKRVTVYGNKLFQRLPFEEWGLKSIPPLSAKRRAEELEGKTKSTVDYPRSLLKPAEVERIIQDYGSDARQGYHRKWLWGSIIGMPITFPFGLIPILPNLPFFYLVFRAWSHWRAQCGSAHIKFLSENRLFDLVPSSILDAVYAVEKVGASIREIEAELDALRRRKAEPVSVPPKEPERMLLSQKDSALIASCVDIPELGPEIERAVWQIERSIKASEELGMEKVELEKASKKR